MRSLMDAQITNFLVGFPTFALTWLTFFLAGIVSFGAQIRLGQSGVSLVGFIKHCFPFEHWTNKSARMDIYMYLISKITDKLVFAIKPLFALLISALVTQVLEVLLPHHATIQPGFLIITGCSFSIFLLVDLTNYVTHYLLHFVPILWAVHKVHHSATFLTAITSRRVHPIEDAFVDVFGGISAGLLAGIFEYAFGFTLIETLFLLLIAERIALIMILDALRHSHFPISFGSFDKILMSPRMHHTHHSCEVRHWDKNFGYKLSVWDWAFGTAVKPGKDERLTFGIGDDDRKYLNLSGLYVGAFQEMWRLAKTMNADSIWRRRTKRFSAP